MSRPKVRRSTGVVLLAGGRGSRLGGVDKGAIQVDGRRLVDRALDAVRGLPVVVVGPPRDLPGVEIVREEPPFAGPAAAVVAGLDALPPVDDVLLLAVDLPRLPEAAPLLLAAVAGADGVVAVDEHGGRQWLLGRYGRAALHRAAAALGDPRDASLRRLLGGLDLAELALPAGLGADVDTVADARAAGAVLPAEHDEELP